MVRVRSAIDVSRSTSSCLTSLSSYSVLLTNENVFFKKHSNWGEMRIPIKRPKNLELIKCGVTKVLIKRSKNLVLMKRGVTKVLDKSKET